MPIQAKEDAAGKMTSSEADRRIEPRNPSEGEVILALAGPARRTISGKLLDTSRSGFRASHSSPLLETGSHVQFSHATAAGVARVCWNRSTGGEWETGFLILPR